MRWQLVQAKGPASWTIGWFGGGGYSHSDVITPTGKLRGARSDIIGGAHKPGYFDRDWDYAAKNWIKRTVFTLEVSPLQEKRYWEFSEEQIGKPYDRRGILGFATGERDWHDPTSWFCSEEIYANAEYAAIFNPTPDDMWKVDPGDLVFSFAQAGATWETFTYGTV